MRLLTEAQRNKQYLAKLDAAISEAIKQKPKAKKSGPSLGDLLGNAMDYLDPKKRAVLGAEMIRASNNSRIAIMAAKLVMQELPKLKQHDEEVPDYVNEISGEEQGTQEEHEQGEQDNDLRTARKQVIDAIHGEEQGTQEEHEQGEQDNEYQHISADLQHLRTARKQVIDAIYDAGEESFDADDKKVLSHIHDGIDAIDTWLANPARLDDAKTQKKGEHIVGEYIKWYHVMRAESKASKSKARDLIKTYRRLIEKYIRLLAEHLDIKVKG